MMKTEISLKKNFLILDSKKFYSEASKIIISKLRNKKIIVITGGKSFIKIYKKKIFCEQDFKQKYFLSDERLVSLKSKNSNYNNIKDYFKTNKLVFFDTSKNSKKRLSEYFYKNFKLKKIDLSLLSFGEDGHIASIFFKKMKSENQLFFSHKNLKRISIPLKILKNSEQTLILCNNRKKTLKVADDIKYKMNFFKYFDKKKYKIIIKKSDYDILTKKLLKN